MDWIYNLDLTENDLNFDAKEYYPQYPHKNSIGGNGVTFAESENKTRFSKDEQTKHYCNGLPAHYFNGGDHNPYYGDADFIAKEIAKYSAPLGKLIAIKYSQTYMQLLNTIDNPITKENQARRQANQYLLRQTQDKKRIVS